MKILLAGGGSGGPIAPLIAVGEKIKQSHPKVKFLLVGSQSGPEAHMSKTAGLPFQAIYSGKLRRYFSVKNLATPFLTVAGFIQAIRILKEFQPDCVFGAGGFVQVPVVWAAWFLKIPVVLHQQDVIPGLSNKLCQLAATKITVSFDASIKGFSESVGVFYQKNKKKLFFTGNPYRENLKEGSRENAIKFFHLKKDMPTLLVFGGGTGAEFINKLLEKALPELAKVVQIIHSSGDGKFLNLKAENYHGFSFIDNMQDAYAVADIVLSRAGLSTLTELSALGKLSIIIPMPNTHQEINALYFGHSNAAIILHQQNTTPESLVRLVRKLLFAPEAQKALISNISKIMPHNAAQKISEIVVKAAEGK